MSQTVLVTGGAGFLGSHLVEALLREGWRVLVVDNFDPYYAPAQKWRNLAPHLANSRLTLVTADLRQLEELRRYLPRWHIDVVVHLAARAGVHASLADPLGYAATNLGGTATLLAWLREVGLPRRLVFASSSSVYGHAATPWSEEQTELAPVSPYAATKLAGETLVRTWGRVEGVETVCLRYFTLYGPRQRPDLALHTFARQLTAGEPLTLYGDGSTRRDLTYVADAVQATLAAMTRALPAHSVINVGTGRTIPLEELVGRLAALLGARPVVRWEPLPPGGLPATEADLTRAAQLLDYQPRVPFLAGLESFVRWFAGAC